MYQPIKRMNARARLPKLSDIEDLIVLDLENESMTMPKYLYENLSNLNTAEQPCGYLLSTANSLTSSDGYFVIYDGLGVASYGFFNAIYGGVRPVIKISKSL